jgi:DnaJ-class molecular chaperone
VSPVVPLGIAAFVIVWAARAYFYPYAPCSRCGGSGSNRGSTSRRFGRCGRCKGTKSRRVLGSKTVHRAVRSLTGRGKW